MYILLMPYRKSPLVTGEIYHVFNRSIAKQPIFLNQRDYKRALGVISFYRHHKPSIRFSHYNRLSADLKQKFIDQLAKENPLLEMLTFCIMPNHVHFLIKQLKDDAISEFMRNFQHSYSKYFNEKNGRVGSLFQSMFKAVLVENDEQLLHVSRYIHLNPVSSSLIRLENLQEYPWGSFREYSSEQYKLTNPKIILSYFKSKNEFIKFVYDQAEQQKKLQAIKHLILE